MVLGRSVARKPGSLTRAHHRRTAKIASASPSHSARGSRPHQTFENAAYRKLRGSSNSGKREVRKADFTKP